MTATGASQQSVQHHGTQYNTFIGGAQARSLAASSPSIAVPQARVAAEQLRGRAAVLRSFDAYFGNHGTGAHAVRTTQVVVLHGLGGCGKTTIALQVARTAIHAGIPTWWVLASAQSEMRAALHAVAFDVGAADADFDHAHPADVLWRHLSTLDRPWLLVIDDVEDPATLAINSRPLHAGVGWVRPPTTSHSLVLVTSRDGRPNRWAPWITVRQVAPLEPDDAARVLIDHAPNAGSYDEARSLATALGGLPLALDLAGRYLAAVAADPLPPDDAVATFAAYQNSLERILVESTTGEPLPGADARDQLHLLGTWEISLDLLVQQGHELARPLMWLLSSFEAAPLPHRVVLRLDVLAESVIFRESTPRQLSGALRALAGLGLVSLSPDPDQVGATDAPRDARHLLEMHPLVRTVTRTNLRASGDEPRYRALLIRLLDSVSQTLDPEDPDSWDVWATLVEHCYAPLRRWSEQDAGTAQELLGAVGPASRAAWYRYMAGLYEEAVAEHGFILAVCRRVLGEDHHETLRTRNSLARALRERGQHDAAEAEFRSTLHISRRALGEDHHETLKIRINLARTLRERGQHDAAEAEFRSTLHISRRALGEDHHETMVILMNLARLLRERGEYGTAAVEWRSVLEKWRARYGEENMMFINIRQEVAEVASKRRSFPEAEREFRSVLSAANRMLGPEHPNTLVIRIGLARMLRESGRPQAASDEFQEILNIQRHRFGDTHPEVRAIEAEMER